MLTQSCVRAMLLCVKPQEAALAHAQPFSVSLAMRAGNGKTKKKKKEWRKRNPALRSARMSATSPAGIQRFPPKCSRSLRCHFSHNC